MRLSKAAILVFTTVSSQVSARVLHRLVNRANSDVCASLANAPLAVRIGSIPSPVTIGLINTCLCISGIPAFESSNIVALAAIAVAGQPATTTALTNLINNAVGHSTCVYPDHFGAAICSANNVCGFSCTDGFTATPLSRPNACTCATPNIVCNGKCMSAAACPSAVPVKRDLEYAQRHSVCEKGNMACGVYGAGTWECVDVKSDLESCGGCTLPLSPGSPRGIDCTAMQGVSDVACVSGACVVGRCLAGYTRTLDSSFCTRNEDLEAAIDTSVLASSYGLEHISLISKGT